jgi:hypothetical protein
MGNNVLVCWEDLDEFGTAEKKIDHLKGEIKETTKLFNKAGKASVETAVRLGSMLIILKELVKGQKKKNWEKYLDSNSPVNKRTAQRCMNLAKTLGDVLQKNVKLSWAGKTRLLELARLAKSQETTVESLLDENNIDLDFNSKKLKEVKAFNYQVDSLIGALKPKKKSKKGKGKQEEKGSANPILELEEVVQTCSSLLEEKKSRKNLLSGLTSAGIEEIVGKVKNLLKQLKSAKEQMPDEETLEEAA